MHLETGGVVDHIVCLQTGGVVVLEAHHETGGVAGYIVGPQTGDVVTPEAHLETGGVDDHIVAPQTGDVAVRIAGHQNGGVVGPGVGPGTGDVTGPAIGGVATQGQDLETGVAGTRAAVEERTRDEGHAHLVYQNIQDQTVKIKNQKLRTAGKKKLVTVFFRWLVQRNWK